MRTARPHAIVFDVEGTLVDCVPQTIKCWQETLVRHQHEFSEQELHRYSGMDAKLMLERLLPSAGESMIKLLLEEQAKNYRAKYLPTVKPFSGVPDLFVELSKAGHRLGLATTCQPDELHAYLRLVDIEGCLTAAVCGNEVKREKPWPDLIERAASKLDATSAAALWMVGDTPYDAEAAVRAGATPIGTRGGGFSSEELMRAGCIAVADDAIQLSMVFQHLWR